MAIDLFKRGFEMDEKSGTQMSDWKWLARYGTKVHEQATAQNAETDIYTVTTGKRLYIISLSLGAQNDAGLSAVPTCSIELADKEIFAANTGTLTGEHEYLTMTFAVPFIATSGQVLQVTSNRTGCFARGAVVGYEI